MPNTPGIGVGIIILNQNEEILLGQRMGDNGRPDGSRIWTAPGGKLELK